MRFAIAVSRDGIPPGVRVSADQIHCSRMSRSASTKLIRIGGTSASSIGVRIGGSIQAGSPSAA